MDTASLRPYATERVSDTNIFTVSKGSNVANETPHIDLGRLTSEWGNSDNLSSLSGFFRQYVSSLAFNYFVVGLILPADAGKTLAQVQWVPKDGIAIAHVRGSKEKSHSNGDTANDDADDIDFDDADETDHTHNSDNKKSKEEIEEYFASGAASNNADRLSFENVSENQSGYGKDASGYIQRNNVTDDLKGTKPGWIMPLVTPAGTWKFMRAVVKFPREGILSLWKGQTASCLLELATSIIQPTLVTLFVDIFVPDRLRGIRKLPLMYAPNPSRMLLVVGAAHALATFIVSPLDLIRTRLIVQAKSAPHVLYKNPFQGLYQIFNDEGRWAGLYLTPTLLIPTLLEAFARPLVHLAGPIVISRVLNIDVTSAPISYAIAEFLWRTSAIIITQPLEIIRRRLQLQVSPSRPSAPKYYSSVELRPIPYTGALDCAYRIATEEDSNPGSTSTIHRYFPGFTKLYTGASTSIVANLFVFLVTVFVGRSDDDAGWTEV